MEFETREINDVVIYDIKWEFKMIEEMPTYLHENVKSRLKVGKRNFLFNLEDVTYLESLGLGVLVGSFISISNLGGRLKLTNLAPKLHLLFEVTGLIKIFDIVDNEETAIAEFSK
ncbi:MAG: STAS domain-containing protein [Candidatus Aminicenantes bacterium]|nr:MAG: STAS domain-containing protein [Candidatus Aminicenantes bacterium]